PIEELNPDVPRWLAEIVGRLLEKSPEQRFQTAGEIGELLGVHLARQQHAGPDALSHSGINARHLATASPQRPSARRTSASPSRPGSQTAGSATLFVGIPWYVRLFGALVLIASLSVVVSQFALTYLTRTDPSIAPRAGGAASHLITSLLWLLPLFVGVLLSRKWISVQFLLVALFLGLGPIGVVLWMLQRERWERTAVDTEAAREIDMRDRQSMYSSALKTTLGATIIAAMVTVSLFHALPGEELRQHFAALVKAAAIALGCIFAVVSMSKLSDGVDRRSLMMTVGAVFWTVLCVPLLCMVGQEAAIAKNASEPFGSLLALIAAGWLIPVAGLLYLLHRRELAASDASVPDASAPLTKRERAWLGFGGVIVWLGSICAMLLIDRDGRLPWGIGAVEWGAILFVGSLVLGIPLLVLWLLLRRREGDDRTLRQRVDDARGQPGKLLAWLAIGCLLLFVVLPVLLIGVGLIVPMFARVDTVRVLVDYDPAAPLTEIRTESGIVYQVSSRPQPIRLPAGRRALHLQYQDSGVPHYLSTTITIPESYVGRELTVDLRNEIAADLHREIEPEFSALPDDAVEASGGVESYGGLDPFPFPSGSMEGGSAEASAELGQLAAATSGPPVAWTTETDSRATMRSGLHVQMLGEGLVLALRKKSLFEGTIGEKETIISEFGNVWGGLEKGEYEWLYRDLHFGWAYDRRGSVTLLDPKQGTLVVRRNLATAIQPAVALPARGGFGVPQPAISQFRWNGDQYDLDPNQSLIVQQLANAAITTEPAVREDQLVAELNRQIVRWSNSPGSFGAFGLSGHSGGGSPSPGSNIVSPVEALKQVFDTASGLHPAWGTLIVPGEESDTFRLAPIELGVLKFNQTDSTRAVTVHTPSGEMESLTPGERSLTLTPGDYAVEFIPEQPDVAWMRPSSDGYVSFPARRTVSVDAGETTVLSLTHELNDAVTPRPLINVPQARDLTVPGYLLRWFGHGNLPAGESPAPPLVDERVYALNDYQALCIGRLMQGIVQQQPDVAESTIVDVAKRAGFMPPEAPADTEPYSGLNEVFPGLQDGSWQALLTPGEQPDTWRLHLPSQD
ncbi:MAG: hypothetical protein KDA75_11115, partial [Planctomycetaceae bacterium]|nr:hypothetical protein [Planctomycetaceae bacterium]